MAFTTMAQVITALPGQRLRFRKSITTPSSGWGSGWAGSGFPAAGADPSSGLSGDVPTIATTGALPLVNAGSGALALARAQASYDQVGATMILLLYDRLWHNSGINATITTSQTINSVALTRPDANGANVEAWWHVYATMGAGTPNVTLTYTDQDGNTGNTTTSGVLATAMATHRTGPFPLAAGDTGVRSIQSWQADATFTSGTIGLILRRRLAEIPIYANADAVQDALRCVLASIPTNACLELVAYSNTGSSHILTGEFDVIEG